MNTQEITSFLSDFDGYFKERSVLQNERAASVWIRFLAPLSPQIGNALIDAIIFNCHFPPSPKQAEALLADLVGIDFKKELKEAIAVYCSGDFRKIQDIPPEISRAVVDAGGAHRFRHATEKQWAELEKDYISFRTKAVQQNNLVALSGGQPLKLEGSR